MASRDRDTLWLIGSLEGELKGSKLPSKREVLKVFFHHNYNEGKTVRDSATTAADMILVFWDKARIPCKLKRNLIPAIEKLVNEYKKLKKNKAN